MSARDWTPKGQYHVGLLNGYMGGRDHDKTVVVEMCRCIDYLSCELWKYMGVRVMTKAQMRRNKSQLLAAINTEFKKNFERIEVW